MTEIRVRDLVKEFGTMTALDKVSVTVSDGEVLALLGPSGSGKTTMLRCIAGLENPSAGTIELGDEVLFGPGKIVPPARRNISMVFQSYALWPHMTVAANVGYGLKVQKAPKALVAERVTEALTLTGMAELGDRYPDQLSGGQQQRVAVARALALRADVVLFDEPLSNLDLKLREEVRVELRRLVKELSITAVYVTHDVGEAVVVADRVAIMRKGQIVQIGQPSEIYHRPATEFVANFVGNVNVLPGVVNRSGSGAVSVDVNGVFDLRSPELAKQIPDDATKVNIVVRPEYVDLQPGDRGQGQPAIVKDSTFLGQTTVFVVDVAGIELRAVTLSRPDLAFVPGDRCLAGFSADNVVVQPLAGEA